MQVLILNFCQIAAQIIFSLQISLFPMFSLIFYP